MNYSSNDMSRNNRPLLLLHACCAVCAIKSIPILSQKWTLELLFENSNIHPRSEWLARLQALKTVSEKYAITTHVTDWSPKQWYTAIGHMSDNTHKRRCRRCWHMRLEKTATATVSHKIPAFSTTLLSSTYQDRSQINTIGKRLAERHAIEWIPYSISANTIPTTQVAPPFYRQNYCGCIYSLLGRYESYTKDIPGT